MIREIKKLIVDDYHLIAKWGVKHAPILLTLLFAYVAIYLFNLIVASFLSPADYGDVAVIVQLLILFAPFVLVGTELAMMRFLPKYFKRGDGESVHGFLKWNIRIFLITAFVILGIGTLIALLVIFTPFFGDKKYQEYHPIIFSYWLIPLFAYMILQSALLQTLKHYFIAAVSKGAALYFICLVAVYIIGAVYGLLGVYPIIFVIGLSIFVIITLQFLVLCISLPKKIKSGESQLDKSKWSNVSVHMMLSSIILSGLQSIDIVMLSILSERDGAVGHFAAIVVLVGVMLVFGSAVNLIVNPQISTGVHEENIDKFQHTLSLTNIIKGVPVVVIYIILIVYGKVFLGFFGQSYVAQYGQMVTLATGYLVWTLLMTATPILLYSGHQKLVVRISGIQLLASIILNFILIPFYGIWGVTITLVITMVSASVISTIMVHRFVNIRVFFLKFF